VFALQLRCFQKFDLKSEIGHNFHDYSLDDLKCFDGVIWNSNAYKDIEWLELWQNQLHWPPLPAIKNTANFDEHPVLYHHLPYLIEHQQLSEINEHLWIQEPIWKKWGHESLAPGQNPLSAPVLRPHIFQREPVSVRLGSYQVSADLLERAGGGQLLQCIP